MNDHLPIKTPADQTNLCHSDTTSQLIALWLHGRSRHTQRAYRADIQRLVTAVPKGLHEVTLADLQGFADGLQACGLEAASCHRILSSIKSFFSFGHRLGYFAFDVARPLRLPGIRNRLSERILEEGDVQRLLALELHPRNHVLLTLLYAAGLRVSEVCGLKWSDFQPRADAGQITVFGKGEKTGTILLPASVCHQMVALRNDAADDQPIFLSRKKGHLRPVQVWRIVGKAARRAGIVKAVSCHWLRHAHASHALDRGAPISLVQSTLGHASLSSTSLYAHAKPQSSSSMYLPV